jgi:hypothetical protein
MPGGINGLGAGLDEALKALAKVDPRKSQVVELRFFGSLNQEETAQVPKLSSRILTQGGDSAITATRSLAPHPNCPSNNHWILFSVPG